MTVTVVTHEDVVGVTAEADPDGNVLVIAQTEPQTVDVSISEGATGPRGPAGPAGPAGSTGPPGPGGRTVLLTHVQDMPAATWTIAYTADYVPLVQVFDSTGDYVDVEIDYTTPGVVRVLAEQQFAGRAYLI